MNKTLPVPRLFLLHGLARSGKGATANIIKEHYRVSGEVHPELPHEVRVLKFAGPLKNMLRGIMRWSGFHDDDIERAIEGDLKEVRLHSLGGFSPREIMQYLGTRLRAPEEDIWLHILRENVRSVNPRKTAAVIIDDVRFPNELKGLSQGMKTVSEQSSNPATQATFDVTTVKIVRPESARRKSIGSGSPQRPRETGLKQVFDSADAMFEGAVNAAHDALLKEIPEAASPEFKRRFAMIEPELVGLLSCFMKGARLDRGTLHVSEHGLPDECFQHVIHNDSGFPALKKKLAKVGIIPDDNGSNDKKMS